MFFLYKQNLANEKFILDILKDLEIQWQRQHTLILTLLPG